MNLAQRDQRPAFAGTFGVEFLKKKFAIAFDGRARVLFRKSQVQRIAPIDARCPALTCGEGMDQPRQFREFAGTQKLKFVLYVFICDALGYHGFMIPEAENGSRVPSPHDLFLNHHFGVDLDFYGVANHGFAGFQRVVVGEIEIFPVDSRRRRNSTA